MSPKSLVHHTLAALLDLFQAARDVIAAIIRPGGPLIRIYHHDLLNAHLGFPANLCVDRVFSYHDSDVTPDTPDNVILERQFERFNIGTSYFAERYRDQWLRSLSENDLVGINDRFYRCESSGWTRIPAPR
ncbi:hypothetical protein [Nocardia niwae]|uniref:hypothetical protein n=1 Tax=Nocardia niwae TaxID=626084 RepID=UPI0033E24B24